MESFTSLRTSVVLNRAHVLGNSEQQRPAHTVLDSTWHGYWASKIPMEMQIVPTGAEKSQNISHTCKEFETTRCTEAFCQSWMMITRNNLRTVWQPGQQAQSSSFYIKREAICTGWTRDFHSPTSRHISTTIHWRRSAAHVCELVPHFNLWELNFELVLVRCELALHCSPLYIVFSEKKHRSTYSKRKNTYGNYK